MTCAVLSDGADGSAEVGALEKQPKCQGSGQGDHKGPDAGPRKAHVGDVQRSQADTQRLELDAEHHGGAGLQQEQHPTGDQQLVDRWGIEHRADHQIMQHGARQRDKNHAKQRRQQEWRAALMGIVDAVHADHHELGVADPHHVDDAEDEVQSQGQQSEQAGQQNAVEKGLGEKDIELAIHR